MEVDVALAAPVPQAETAPSAMLSRVLEEAPTPALVPLVAEAPMPEGETAPKDMPPPPGTVAQPVALEAAPPPALVPPSAAVRPTVSFSAATKGAAPAPKEAATGGAPEGNPPTGERAALAWAHVTCTTTHSTTHNERALPRTLTHTRHAPKRPRIPWPAIDPSPGN